MPIKAQLKLAQIRKEGGKILKIIAELPGCI